MTHESTLAQRRDQLNQIETKYRDLMHEYQLADGERETLRRKHHALNNAVNILSSPAEKFEAKEELARVEGALTAIEKRIEQLGQARDKQAAIFENLEQQLHTERRYQPESWTTSQFLVGRDDLLQELQQRVLGNGRYVILLKTPGVGKTELLAHLVQRAEIQANFAGILWAPLGREPDIHSLQLEWCQQLGMSVDKFAGRDEAGRATAIRRFIAERQLKLLLIIDDIWDVQDGACFDVGGSECTTLVTTRRDEVSGHFFQQERATIIVPELSTEDGLQLLRHLAPDAVNKQPEATRELVETVNGLPLALVLMGKYLQQKGTTGQWYALKRALQDLQRAKTRLKIELTSHQLHQPLDQPLSLEVSIGMSESILDSELRQLFRDITIFRAKPGQFSLAAAASVCLPLADEDALYEDLLAIHGVALLTAVPDLHEDANAHIPDWDTLDPWEREQLSPKFTVPQIIADYGREKLAKEDPERLRALHHRAANYYANCLQNYEETRNGDASSYERMYSYELPEWQRIKSAWLYHLTHTSVSDTNLAFARLYFDAFWWWGCYCEFPFCEKLVTERHHRQTVTPDWRQHINQFHRAYPTGYDKRGKGDWTAVAKALHALRKLSNMDGDWRSLDKQRQHLRAITNIFLAESYRYRNVTDPRAAQIYQETLDMLLMVGADEDDAWLIPWLHWHLSDLYLEQGLASEALAQVRQGLDLAVAVTGDDWCDQDSEIIANLYRVEADVHWQCDHVNLACRRYADALLYAYGFQACPKPPDFYTVLFYREMVERILDRLQALWLARPQETLTACVFFRDYWQLYWQQAGDTAVMDEEYFWALLQEENWTSLVSALFPPQPTKPDIDASEHSTYYQQALTIFKQILAAWEPGD